MQELRFLSLDGNGVHDEGIRHLNSNDKLRTLIAQGSAITIAGARELAEQLPELTIILRDDVVKSPRRSITFRRELIADNCSVFLPTHWGRREQEAWQSGPTLVEDGWEEIGGWSGQNVGPAEIRLVFEENENKTAERAMKAVVQNNSHLNPRVLHRKVVDLSGPRDTASCIFRDDHGQHLVCTAHSKQDNTLCYFKCSVVPPRFPDFLPLFLYIARSVRIGKVAKRNLGKLIEFSTDKLSQP